MKKRRVSTTDARGVITTKFYNIKNQLVRVVEVAPDGSTVLTTHYTYDDFGRLDNKRLPNGMIVEYDYDGFDRLQAVRELEGSDADVSNNAPSITSSPPSIITINSGEVFPYDVNATDNDGNAFQFYLVSSPEGMTINSNTGLISWTPDITQGGDHLIVVQVVDDQGGVEEQIFTISVNAPSNEDGDSVADQEDNCIQTVNDDQRDTDNDGFGNICDGDLNNDGIVNFADLAAFKAVFNSSDRDADFDGNGVVDSADLDVLKQSMFGKPPGPSGVAP